MFGFANPRKLRQMGIVGMNQRNVDYIAKYNARHLYPLVDDKLKTKELCNDHHIASPTLLGVCRSQRNTQELAAFLSRYDEFVIKPAKGSGGKGILVINHCDENGFFKPSGECLQIDDIKRHVSNTLSGLYSLGGQPDVALIEAMVHFTDTFEGYSISGVPDIRVIVFKGYPIMAMTRLSTSMSDGKANLHQGAVGVGLDLATGNALRAVQNDKPVTHHPDSGKCLADISIPSWDELLILAAKGYEITGLGYLGVDIVLDKDRGPLLLELNARPGLAIQVANGRGLGKRVSHIRELEGVNHKTAAQKADYAQQVIARL